MNVNPQKLAKCMEIYLEDTRPEFINSSKFEIDEVDGFQVIEMMRIIFERVIKVVSEQEELVWSDKEIKRIMENE